MTRSLSEWREAITASGAFWMRIRQSTENASGGSTPFPDPASLDMKHGEQGHGSAVEGPRGLTGSYDPDLDLIYWGVGNPGPDFQGDVRPGVNLYTCAVIAAKRQLVACVGITSSARTTNTTGTQPKYPCSLMPSTRLNPVS